MTTRLNSRLGQYLGIMLIISLTLGGILSFGYYGAVPHGGSEIEIRPDTGARESVGTALTQVYFILLIISGVIAWLFVLVHESRKVANEETRRQTSLLMREIRAHSRNDRKLQRAKEVAEAANHAKSRYVIGISHELRSPLNAISGYAQLIRRDPVIPEHSRETIDVIKNSADHLAGLIEGLLDISKIEAGHLTIYRECFNLHELLTQIVDMFRLQADAKVIDFVYAPSDYLPTHVYGNEKRLRQVLINLLSNAIKWTHEGGVTLEVNYHSQVAEFSVIDTGIGIVPENLDRIFIPFERVDDREGAPPVPGMGLGLAITKLLAEVMGGDIRVESMPEKGSTFLVRILLSSAQQPMEPQSPEKAILGL